MKPVTMIPALVLSTLLIGCGEKKSATAGDAASVDGVHGHPHDGEQAAPDDHDHGAEVSIGTFTAGDIEIEASQAHGAIEAGKEGHLIIKLPYNDDGATVIRAWIGTEDRTMSTVGKGEYASSHGDYDIHAMTPSPLPKDAKWWVELEKPDGTKCVGSVAPKM